MATTPEKGQSGAPTTKPKSRKSPAKKPTPETVAPEAASTPIPPAPAKILGGVRAFRAVTPWHKRPYDVLLFGPTGFTGKRILERLSRMDLSVAIAGRDAETISSLVAEHDGVHLGMLADVTDHDSMVKAFQEARVVINCVGPFLDHGHKAVDAAIEARTFLMDPSGEQAWMNQLYRRHREISEAGILVVSGQAAMPALGDLGIYLLQTAFEEVRNIHVGYMISGVSPAKGTLVAMARYLGEPGLVYENGYWRIARLGEMSHQFRMNKEKMAAASYPAGEAVMVPRRLDCENVTGYIVAQGPGSLLIRQGLPNLLRFMTPEVGKALSDIVDKIPQGFFSNQDEHHNRATTLIEMEGTLGGEPLKIRGAIGAEDAYDITADLLVYGAYYLVYTPPKQRGALTPAQAFDGFKLLNMLKNRGLFISGSLSDVLTGFAIGQ